jgi:hypothetical protein
VELRTRARWSSLTVRSWDLAVLATTIVMLGWLFYKNAMLASRVVDGTRYFLLDDDMMISMRYARNLAEGQGLVWNPGERVEGYTNFLWTIVMAVLHLTKVADANMALLVKAAGFAFLAGTFHLSLRMLRIFAPRSYIAAPMLCVSMIMCVDIMHWSVWGFETTMLSFLNMLFLLRIVERREDVLCFGALSLIALTRGDGLHIVAANACIALFLSKDPRRTAFKLALALVPFAAHLVFRRIYYGDFLPNTYYLKVYALDDVRRRGATYARNFLLTYSILLTLAAGAGLAIVRTDRRGVVLFATVLATLGYVINTGGDMFGNFRFFAHVMPVIYVFAAAGIATAVRERVAGAVWAAVLFLVSVPLIKPLDRLIVLDSNGDPYEQIQTAMIVKKNARPDSSIAVIPAGILPYFTRMRAIDILGKTDSHIAHMVPFPGSMVGHGKLDPDYTLGLKPDLVVSCRSYAYAAGLAAGVRTTDVVFSFLSSVPFRNRYMVNAISEDFTLGRTAIYTNTGSNEYPHRTWKSVTVSP